MAGRLLAGTDDIVGGSKRATPVQPGMRMTAAALPGHGRRRVVRVPEDHAKEMVAVSTPRAEQRAGALGRGADVVGLYGHGQ